ncbi:hypothetical protein VTJ49DRAFT_6474 [Mycothermus thermophilus]|uniref:Major facilitator superfamily (MFS) profile domain-containing protein n=1 Tax=Humicola insolens TaxID=85995 RepID=A0ABR3VIZ8_HUMIN
MEDETAVIGSVVTILAIQYGDVWNSSNAKQVMGSIAFAGTVVGQLVFGYLSDKWSRTDSLILSTIILLVSTILTAGSYYHNDAIGMFSVLITWRFFVGIGIGGEYPAGSVACVESTGTLKSSTRNTWFILFTNTMINWGFVFGAFVPYVVSAACHNQHLETIWRVSLGIGAVFPAVLLVLRSSVQEPEPFQKHSMKHTKTPYRLVLRFYGLRVLAVSLVWFIYDFSAYSFSIYSSTILSNLLGTSSQSPALTTIFGWNTVLNLFYIPGSLLGAPLSDLLGPRYALTLGVLLQAAAGFAISARYADLTAPGRSVAGFAAAYGAFLSLGELGPGNNIGLVAAAVCATGVRGQCYGVASAMGKVGAFVGTLVFPYVAAAGKRVVGSEVGAAQYPFWVASGMCVLAAGLVLVGVPGRVGREGVEVEDERFREFLEQNGFDTATMGLRKDGEANGEGARENVETVGPREEKKDGENGDGDTQRPSEGIQG